MPSMPLLQSGATASFDINPSTIPLANLIVIVAFIAFALMAVLFVIVRYVKKIGPLDLSKEHTIQTFVYNMNRENAELDDQLRIKIRLITSSLKTRLNNIFFEFQVCPVVLIALSNSVRGPLYNSANNNHFTTVLLPENRDNYIDGLLRAIEDEYQAVFNAITEVKCEKERYIPEWSSPDPGGSDKDAMKARIRMFLMEWSQDVVTETIKTCQKKIEVYKKHEPQFRADSYRSSIVVSCIAKNEQYISLLDRHGKPSWN